LDFDPDCSRPLAFSAFDPKRRSAADMLSFPHLVVLFVVALIIFGPQKLPELARMLGKATAEFRKMTNDFRYALEDEVRDLERQTRIRDAEIASATLAAQTPVPMPTAPEGSVPRETPEPNPYVPAETQSDASHVPHADSGAPQPPEEALSTPHEKSPDDNNAV
jgi:sec-independent protein translocase protein TatB